MGGGEWGGGEGGNNPGIQTNNNFSFRNCLPSTIFSVSISNLLSCRSGIHTILKLGLRKRQVRPSSLLFSTLLWSDAHRKTKFGSAVKFYIRTVPNFYLCASFPMEFVFFFCWSLVVIESKKPSFFWWSPHTGLFFDSFLSNDTYVSKKIGSALKFCMMMVQWISSEYYFNPEKATFEIRNEIFIEI